MSNGEFMKAKECMDLRDSCKDKVFNSLQVFIGETDLKFINVHKRIDKGLYLHITELIMLIAALIGIYGRP